VFLNLLLDYQRYCEYLIYTCFTERHVQASIMTRSTSFHPPSTHTHTHTHKHAWTDRYVLACKLTYLILRGIRNKIVFFSYKIKYFLSSCYELSPMQNRSDHETHKMSRPAQWIFTFTSLIRRIVLTCRPGTQAAHIRLRRMPAHNCKDRPHACASLSTTGISCAQLRQMGHG